MIILFKNGTEVQVKSEIAETIQKVLDEGTSSPFFMVIDAQTKKTVFTVQLVEIACIREELI